MLYKLLQVLKNLWSSEIVAELLVVIVREIALAIVNAILTAVFGKDKHEKVEEVLDKLRS